MSFELAGAGVPEELPCRYGASKLMCRGPRRALDKPYVALLGGSETFGKFVDPPFAALVERDLVATGDNLCCVNLGCVNAGLDAFVHDAEILSIAQGAALTVIQVLGAQNLSNRFYRVHPRRNDRFLTASPMLSAIYREVDFTEFHFNRHLLSTLRMLSPERFAIVQEELRQAWVARMRLLLRPLGGRVLMLWLRYGSGDQADTADHDLGPEPLLVDRAMLDALRPEIMDVVELPVSPAGQTGELAQMRYGPLQAPAAEHLIGPDTHRAIADKLGQAIRGAV